MGLVQLFHDAPCPDVMARHLLDAALADFRESGHHYLMHLVAERDFARCRGTAEEVADLDKLIHEHAIHEQIPQRWRLDYLFSPAGYDTYSKGLFGVWAASLIEICTLEQYWEHALLGLPPQNPCLLPGFHADKDVFATVWLQEARRTWSEELAIRSAHRPSQKRSSCSSVSQHQVMAPRWRLKATSIEGGFALRLIGDGDLGKAINDAESVTVEMEDGRILRLYEALVAMIESRVTGFIVLTERVDQCEELLH